MSPRLLPLLALAPLVIACGHADDPAHAAASGSDPAAVPAVGETPPVPDRPATIKAIWVTRFDYRTADDVREVVASCVEAGFDTILFQVRGNATAFYDSPYEPWALELAGSGPGGDPGFDPLALAVDEARRLGVSLHAWVNVMPSWWGLEPPPEGGQPPHLYHARPAWHWWSAEGERQALSDKFYVSLNPCLPEVRRYLTEVVVDIARRYEVEGVHLDYIRFPNEFPATPRDAAGQPTADYPRDPRTLALYREATGLHPDDAPEGGGEHPWDAWRTGQVTELVRSIRAGLGGLGEDAPLLTAAVGSVPERALHHFQDGRGWLDAGLVDAVFPMNYSQDLAVFDERLAHWTLPAGDGGPRVVMGVRASEQGDDARTLELLARAVEHGGGFCLFAYSDLFDSANETIDSQDEATRARRARARQVLLPYLRRL